MEATSERVRFGKYWLLRRLAKGGMAELFLAMPVDPARQNERLVVKRMLPQFTEDQDFLQMFLQEAKLASQLAHPGCVRILDLGLEGSHLYIGMEYIDGRDLEEVTRGRRQVLPPTLAARIVSEVCGALAYAHGATDLAKKPMRIVHRDVTPANVMLGRRGEVKLVDFGVAKASAQLSATRPGVIKGKLSYMAPEVIRGMEIDGRADLFSLGATLYEITTGIKPFERVQLPDSINAILTEHPPGPEAIRPGFPPQLSAIVMKALEKNRERRYGSAREMKADLDRFLSTARPAVGPADIAALVAGVPLPPPMPQDDEEDETANHTQRAAAPLEELPSAPQMAPRPGTPARAQPARSVATPARPVAAPARPQSAPLRPAAPPPPPREAVAAPVREPMMPAPPPPPRGAIASFNEDDEVKTRPASPSALAMGLVPPAPAAKAPTPPPPPPPPSPEDFAPPVPEQPAPAQAPSPASPAALSPGAPAPSRSGTGTTVLKVVLGLLVVVGAVWAGRYSAMREIDERFAVLQAQLPKAPEPVAAPPGPDAGPPAGPDAGPDAGVEPDAGAVPDAGMAPADPPKAASAEPAAAPVAGVIAVQGSGAVMIDDKQCQAPCATHVVPGEHVVRLQGKSRVEKRVTVLPGEKKVVSFP